MENLAVPLYDVFSYTAQGTRLIAHYWLSDAVFYLVYEATGYRGLMVFAGFIGMAAYFLLYKAGNRFLSGGMAPVLLIMLAFLTFELWVVRAQIFSYFFVALLLLLLEKKKFVWIIPLMLVWANAHAGVVLGIAILAWHAAVWMIEHRKEIKNISGLCRMSGYRLWMYIAAAGATLLNPNGLESLTYSQTISQSVDVLQIAEWKSLFYYIGGTWQSVAYLCLMVAVLAVYIFGKCKTVWLSGMLVGALALPIISIRHVGFFPFLAYLPLAAAVSTMLFSFERVKRILVPAAAVFLVLLCGYGVYRYATLTTLNHHVLPERAADFIQEHTLEGNMFNTQPVGGWLMWKLWPERLVYYDGRNELYTGEMDAELRGIETGLLDPSAVFEKRNIQYAVLHYRDYFTLVPAQPIAQLFARITRENDFKLVFWDDSSIVLVKASGPNKAVAEKFGYEHISPFFIKNGTKQDIAAEFDRALNAAPDSDSVRLTAQNIISQF